MTSPSITAGKRVTGRAMPLAASQATSPWNVLAYATKLRGRGAGVELTSADFASCVANFTRWGREIPVVLYHADTDATAHPDSRKAHAWIVEMRVGAMQRGAVDRPVATLEARFRWVNEATRASVDCGELAFGSITIVQGGVDEETGAECGSFLWSFSLTNNPALIDLPRIAASRTLAAGAWYGDLDDRDDVVEMLRCILGLPALADEAAIAAELAKLAALLAAPDDASGIDADDIIASLRSAMRLPALTSAADVFAAIRAALAPTPSAPGEMPEGHNDSADSRSMSRGSRAAKETRMSTTTMMALAARLGFAAPTEEAAAQHVAARAEESTEVRRSLGLPLASDAQAVAAKITALHSDAAKVAVLSAENEALKSVETERHNREVVEHVEALCADPVMAKSRAALESFARNDFAAFSKAYPKPAVTAASLALTSRVTGLGGEKTPTIVSGRAARHNDAAADRAKELMAADKGLSLESALKQASRELRAGKGS
mgnify:FL=1